MLRDNNGDQRWRCEAETYDEINHPGCVWYNLDYNGNDMRHLTGLNRTIRGKSFEKRWGLGLSDQIYQICFIRFSLVDDIYLWRVEYQWLNCIIIYQKICAETNMCFYSVQLNYIPEKDLCSKHNSTCWSGNPIIFLMFNFNMLWSIIRLIRKLIWTHPLHVLNAFIIQTEFQLDGHIHYAVLDSCVWDTVSHILQNYVNWM